MNITSEQNPIIKNIIKLKDKKHQRKTNMFIIENQKVINIANKLDLIETIFSSEKEGKDTILVTRGIIKKISDTNNPSNVVAVCRKPDIKSKEKKVIVLNNIQDPGNVGTLIRTAVAFGFDTIVVEGANPYMQKVVRSTQGALFKIKIIEMNSAQYLKEFKGKIISTVLQKGSKKYDEILINEPFALVLGNEGNGISPEVLDLSNETCYIPIKFESLNVAQAGAIFINYFSNIV
ncbi:MAG: RNA methyltransferase [Mycoplasma sp.]|nr:RNA methyltransferase [Mycoplasma sp.]